jgi:hypothetical protein
MKVIDKKPEGNWKTYLNKPVKRNALLMEEEFNVQTLEGVMHGNAGDYLMEGVNGELYPCKPDIFAKTYTEVTE